MAFYFSKRKVRPKEEEETGELNIIPYLDILMNLIIFILLSMTGLATFGILNVNAPNYGGGAGASDTPQKPPLLLNVAIGKKGFYVAATGGVLGGGAEEQAAAVPTGDRPPTIPRLGDGSLDYATLTNKMKEVKTAFPEETKVILAAESDTKYEELVGTMDATRETPNDHKLLFPDVTLAVY
ncbi:MAG: biopolymer transporter ExbD [Myxococcaceae bacterium]|nr:biopolymer transporter ExbD [Myxococcaceae bacterium]